ncbi:MAG TPA: hypothetical protein VFQ38_05570 [Longimicrobiales bacterium]|nr:hypothetical protein [Longimicrobiales bacterium]
MRRSALATMVVLLLGLPRLAAAQGANTETLRRSFPYLGDALTIDVVADAAGRIRLIHGANGVVEVTARATEGFSGIGVPTLEGGHMTLTAVGAKQVEYLVAVPAAIRVQVVLPGREGAEVFGRTSRTASWDWPAPAKPGTGR